MKLGLAEYHIWLVTWLTFSCNKILSNLFLYPGINPFMLLYATILGRVNSGYWNTFSLPSTFGCTILSLDYKWGLRFPNKLTGNFCMLASACLTADLANNLRRKKYILVMSSCSSLPLFLLSVCLHSDASLLKEINTLLYIIAPLGTILCLSLPSIDVNNFGNLFFFPTSRAVTIGEMGVEDLFLRSSD